MRVSGHHVRFGRYCGLGGGCLGLFIEAFTDYFVDDDEEEDGCDYREYYYEDGGGCAGGFFGGSDVGGYVWCWTTIIIDAVGRIAAQGASETIGGIEVVLCHAGSAVAATAACRAGGVAN